MKSRSSTGAAYLLDKRPGISSRKAASEVASFWKYSKFGHAGTLDPDATGLLIVLMGRATRLARFLSVRAKTYSFGIRLGIRTDTDDISGEVLEESGIPAELSETMLMQILERFSGKIMQRVPSYSAVRVDGRRAYSIARQGGHPETPVREVTCSGWNVDEFSPPDIRLSVKVTTGTYVRALARDIGGAIGCGGAAFDIRRTAVGDISVAKASPERDDRRALLGMLEIMADYPRILIGDRDKMTVSHGGRIEGALEGTVVLASGDDVPRLIAVAEGDGSYLQPVCVLRGPDDE